MCLKRSSNLILLEGRILSRHRRLLSFGEVCLLMVKVEGVVKVTEQNFGSNTDKRCANVIAIKFMFFKYICVI
jgi:hypothetical protein